MIYNKLIEYINQGFSSFHTPGHKNNFEKLLGKSGLSFGELDLTELPLTDNLYNPQSCILQAENNLKELYGSKTSLFSTGGNTLCIQTMLRLCAPEGGKMICARNVHKSVVSAMALLKIEPIWVMPEFDEKNGLFSEVSSEEISKVLKIHTNTKGVLITSPDYYGMLSNVKSLAAVCAKFGVPLLVDNAHGAHLKFLTDLNHPIDDGATFVADSAHKTLPVLTGGAWLHISDEKFITGAKNAMSLFGSTSPSYPIMASIDVCTNWLKSHGKVEFKALEKRVSLIKEVLKFKNISFPKNMCDPTRITINCASVGYTGDELKAHFHRFKVEPEFFDANHTVLIPTPFNFDADWLNLENALLDLEIKEPKKTDKNSSVKNLPIKILSISNTIFKKSETILIKNSKNRIAAEILHNYPPGIPIIMPGELIDNYVIQALVSQKVNKISVLK